VGSGRRTPSGESPPPSGPETYGWISSKSSTAFPKTSPAPTRRNPSRLSRGSSRPPPYPETSSPTSSPTPAPPSLPRRSRAGVATRPRSTQSLPSSRSEGSSISGKRGNRDSNVQTRSRSGVQGGSEAPIGPISAPHRYGIGLPGAAPPPLKKHHFPDRGIQILQSNGHHGALPRHGRHQPSRSGRARFRYPPPIKTRRIQAIREEQTN